MKMIELQNEFVRISESKIIQLDFDMLRNSIRMSLELASDCEERHCELVFENVSSYYFVNDTKEARKSFIEYEKGDYLELTDINCIEGSMILQPKSDEKWIEQFGSSANIAIEIWSMFLFIEASKVIIGDKVFDL